MTVAYALGGTFVVFIMGAIFWAGATYNRVSGIEARLAAIELILGRFAGIAVVEQRVTEAERRITALETRIAA